MSHREQNAAVMGRTRRPAVIAKQGRAHAARDDVLSPEAIARHIIAAYARMGDERLADIENDLDWSAPNIAFYGETSAGKSTLIETLRVLFGASGGKAGHSIGDGSPDNTLKATAYACRHEGAAFNLVDLPGIEGDEAKVIREVERAVHRAHAVFYVTADARPPQLGEKGQPGTLEKIMRHLKPQAKVWAVYNKKVKGPGGVQQHLLNDDERQSLAEGPHSLDGTMRTVLGGQYQGHVALSAEPGLLALPGELAPGTRLVTQREKFLAKFGAEALLQFSNIENFGALLRQNIPGEAEIFQANIRKLVRPVEEAAEGLEREAETQFVGPAKTMRRQLSKLRPELEAIADDASKGMSRLANELTDGAIKRVREKMLKAIDGGLAGDEALRMRLELVLAEERAGLPGVVDARVEATVKRTLQSCEEALELFKKHLRQANAFDSAAFASTFEHTVEVSTKSGINWGGVAGTAAGIALTLLTGGGFAIIAGITSLLSFVHSFWNFFVQDYTKSQQKQSLNKNLDDMKPKIRGNIVEALKSVEDLLRDHVLGLMTPLHDVVEGLQKADGIVTDAARAWRQLAGNGGELRGYAEAAALRLGRTDRKRA